MFAWVLPLRSSGAAVGTPWGFALRACTGDLGVSTTSGIDVGPRVRVHLVGTLALGLGAGLVAALVIAAGRWVTARRFTARPHRQSTRIGRAGLAAAFAAPTLFGVIIRWWDPVPAGLQLGDAALDRMRALLLPSLAAGITLAFIARRRGVGHGRRAVVARDWHEAIFAVLLTEIAFGLPGIGALFRDAVDTADVALVRGVVLVVAIAMALRPSPGGELTSPPRVTSPRAHTAAAVTAVVSVSALVSADWLGLGSAVVPGDALVWSDHLDRDVLARALISGRVTFALVVGAIGLSVAAGAALGFIVGSMRGRIVEFAARGRAVGTPFMLAGAALLGAGPRRPLTTIAVLGVVVLPTFASRCADAADRAWRSRGLVPVRAAAARLVPVAVSAVGMAFVVEATWGLAGLAPDGRTTLGRELAEQLPHAAGSPAGALVPALLVVIVGWSLGTLGYGFVPRRSSRPASARSPSIAAQSASDGRPQPAS